MAMTMTEKILARAGGVETVEPGQIVIAEVDRAVLTDTIFSASMMPWRTPVSVPHPERVVVVLDHAVPAPSAWDAKAHASAREFARAFEVNEISDVGSHGISHQVIAEQGLARPGELLVCGDSHTGAAGAFNSAGRGVGGLEMLQVVCTGKTWFAVSPTIAVTLTGALPSSCDGKDAFLTLAGRFGSAENANVEFGGDGAASLSLHDRRTITTQCTEIHAEFTLFPADDLIIDYLAERGVTDFQPVAADDGASYEAGWELDLSSVEPMVATPGAVVDRVCKASDTGSIRLDQCFIGSCANGHLEDFAVAAEVLDGQTIANGTRLIVTPASQRVYLDAVNAGYVSTIVEAGGVVTPSTCGACWGYHMGVLGAGETCLTSSTRNFKGRMGSPDSLVYMGSTRTVAASAIAGEIVDPRLVGAGAHGH